MVSNLLTKLISKNIKTPKRLRIIASLPFFIPFILLTTETKAQDFFLPTSDLSLLRMERKGVATQKKVHFGYKPILFASANVADVEGLGVDTTKYYYAVTQKIFSQHLIEFETTGLKLHADPLVDFSYGKEIKSSEDHKTTLYTNTRGFTVSAQIGENVFIHTDFRENQGRFPNYINHFVDSLKVFPGNGRVKPFKETGYDFSMANGFVGIAAAQWLHFNFGHGKQFIGHGYRSILLSDNAFNYPYAGYILDFGYGKFQFRYNIQLMQNLERLPRGDTPESIFKRKYANHNYLSYKPLPNIEIGLFETVVWKYYNDSTGTMPFNANALNPVILLNTAIEGFDNPKANAIIGLNTAWQPFKMWRLYGQIMLDNPNRENYGYQLGSKVYNVLGNINLLAEHNFVSSGSYSASEVLQGYTNHNQPLAHPMGAGFKEYIAKVIYLNKRFSLSAKYVRADFKASGRDPMKPSLNDIKYPNEKLEFKEIEAAYIFNPKTNLQIYAQFVDRTEKHVKGKTNNQFWYFGLRTNLKNIYTDF